ncbi:hypothetical protein Tco_0815324 [Tanacetum coccineum]
MIETRNMKSEVIDWKRVEFEKVAGSHSNDTSWYKYACGYAYVARVMQSASKGKGLIDLKELMVIQLSPYALDHAQLDC